LHFFFLDTTAYIVEMKILSSFFFLFALHSFGSVDIYDNSNRFIDRDDNSINYANMEKNLPSQTIIQSNVDYNFLPSENFSSVKKWYFKPYFYKILCYYGNRWYIVLNLNHVVCPTTKCFCFRKKVCIKRYMCMRLTNCYKDKVDWAFSHFCTEYT
jgi:hypothetical protein